MDESLPAGNSIAIDSLLELGYLEGNKEYIDAAQRAIVSSSDSIQRSNTSHASLLMASMDSITPKKIIIIRCPINDIKGYKEKLFSLEEVNYYFVDSEAVDVPKELSLKKPIGSFTAYICEGFKCLAPIDSFEQLLKELSQE